MFTRRSMLKWLGLGCLSGATGTAVACKLPVSTATKRPLLRIVPPTSSTVTAIRDQHGRELCAVTRLKVYTQPDKQGMVKLYLLELSTAGKQLAQRDDTVTRWGCEVENGKPVCKDEYGNIVEGVDVLSWEVELNGLVTWTVACSCELVSPSETP